MHHQKLYEYDDSQQLSKLTSKSLNSQRWVFEHEFPQIDRFIATTIITDFFYTDQKLDSTITKYHYSSNPKFNFKSKTIYDENGLRYKTIEKDTIITTYIHEKIN